MPTQTTLSRVESFPFDSRSDGYDAEGYPVYDRAVGASMLRSTFAKFFSDGVFPSPGDALQISKGSGLTVTIQPGIFIIRGAMGGYLTDAHSLTLDTAAPQGNVCYGIMLRYDETEQYRSCYLRVVRGDAASSPQPPAPDQSTPGVMEYRLGYVTVPTGSTDLTSATVTNERGLAVCPYAAPFEEIDVSEIVSDTRLAANEALTQLLDYFETYRQMVDDAVDDTLAGSLQTQITALQQQLDNFDLSGSVDNETVVYNTLPGGIDKKLRVNQLSLSKDYLTIELQTELGILDTSDWDFDTYYSTAQGLSGELQDQYIESIPAGAVNTWTASQLKQMIDLVSDEADANLISKLSSSTVSGWGYSDISQFFGMDQALEASFISKIPNSAVNSWEFDQIKSSFQAVNDQNLPALSTKVDMSTIQSWTAAQITSIASVSDSAFQKRLASSFPVETCSWAELSQFANAVHTSALSSCVGKEKSGASSTWVCIGVGHDDLVGGGKAALTFMERNQRSNSNGYAGYIEGISYFEDNAYPQFDPDIKPYIKQVVKTARAFNKNTSPRDYGGEVGTYNLHLWEISAKEAGASNNGFLSVENDGNVYAYFSGADAATKRTRFGVGNSYIGNSGYVLCRGCTPNGGAYQKVYVNRWYIETGTFPSSYEVDSRLSRCACMCI